MAITTQLFAHQTDAVNHFVNKSYGALIFEPGLGKTLIALAIVDARRALYPAYQTLVIVPNTLVENWLREAKRHTQLETIALLGSRAARVKLLKHPAPVHVINYEGARTIVDELCGTRYNLLICDESQCCKDHSSLQSKACYKISQQVPHKLIMTGTPIMNSPLDVFGQYRLLNPGIYGPSYYSFRARYAIMGGYMGKQVTKYINLPDFKRRFESCALVRTKEECLDLPDKLYERVHLDLPAEQAGVYKTLADEFIAQFNNTTILAPIVLTRLMRFSQITAGFYKDTEGVEHAFKTNPKQDWLVSWVKEHRKKVVVFCRFIHEIKALEAALTQAGIGHTAIHGAVKDRMACVDLFSTDDKCFVFIGQLDVAGQGLTLTAASYCVFLSNSYSYGDRVQAEDRIHRISATRNCTYIDLAYRETIDVRILEALEEKQDLAAIVKRDVRDLI